MTRLETRLKEWENKKEEYNFEDLVMELKNSSIVESIEYSKYEDKNKDVKEQINCCLSEIKSLIGDIEEEYYCCLGELIEHLFLKLNTSYLQILYDYSNKKYEYLFVEIIKYYTETFNKIEILVNRYGEKNIYFNDIEELLDDFSFYENYVLQTEHLIGIIASDKFLNQKIKEELICKLIPIEIINIDYLLSINKLFNKGKFISYSIDKELKACYLDRFHKLSDLYQNYINLRIISFPQSKDVVEMKIKQMNIRNKYEFETDKYIVPEI